MTVIGIVALLGLATTMLAGELYIGGRRERREAQDLTHTPKHEEPGY